MSCDALLVIALEAAVPLWAHRLQKHPFDYVLERARVCGQAIAEHGDIIQFKQETKKGKPGTAAAFNHLAEGLAALSFFPGGVRFLGAHWENSHPDQEK